MHNNVDTEDFPPVNEKQQRTAKWRKKKKAALKNGAGLIYQRASVYMVLSLYQDSSHRSVMTQALMVYLFTGHNKYNWHLQ